MRKTDKFVEELLDLVPEEAIKDPPVPKEVTDCITQTPAHWCVSQDKHTETISTYLTYINNQKNWTTNKLDTILQQLSVLSQNCAQNEDKLKIFREKSNAQSSYYSSIIQQVNKKVDETEQMI